MLLGLWFYQKKRLEDKKTPKTSWNLQYTVYKEK
jgi:hypothetical protein